MSKIERLIEELCPDGVEYKKIDTFLEVLRGKRLTKKELTITGTYPVYHGGLQPLGYYTDYNRNEKTVMIINVGASAGTVGYSDTKFWSSDGCYCLSFNAEIMPKFLYYYLVNNEIHFISKVRYAGIPTLDKKIIENFEIPVPPLPIQEEIVRILDSFTEKTNELKAKLEEELEARKKQYEWYRNELLIEKKEYLLKELGSVCTFVRGPFGGALKKEIFKTEGYAVYEQQNAIYQNLSFRYFVDSEKFTKLERFSIKPGDMIVSCSGTIGKTFIIPIEAPKGIINQALLKLTPNREMINVYYLQFFFENTISKLLNNVSRGGAIKNVPSVNELKKIKIPLPSLEEQQRIVDILDRFDKLCNDISEGLPAEIDARQKQYEYYRDKLLTFKRLEDREGIEDERV